MKVLFPVWLAALCGCAQLQPVSDPREADCRVAGEAMASIVDGRMGQTTPQLESQPDHAPVLIKTPEQVFAERMMDWDQRALARPVQPSKTERDRAHYNNQLVVTHAYSLSPAGWLPNERSQAVDAYVRDCRSAKIKIWGSKELVPPVADLL